MTRLFYKDMKEHETAYKHVRADEATNDLILGAKVNAYTGFEEAKTNAIDEIATNYGKFLKALQVKNIPLNNPIEPIKKQENKLIKSIVDTSVGTQDDMFGTISQSDSNINEVFTGLNPNQSDEVKAIRGAINDITDKRNVASALKSARSKLTSKLNEDLTKILHGLKFKATTSPRNKSEQGFPLTMDGLTIGLQNLYNSKISQK